MRPDTDAMLDQVARIYRFAAEDGKHPVDAVAGALGLTYAAAKQRIYRARQAGKDLTPRRRGAVA
jgi:hypothetical protein